jgi:hypothetical protein
MKIRVLRVIAVAAALSPACANPSAPSGSAAPHTAQPAAALSGTSSAPVTSAMTSSTSPAPVQLDPAPSAPAPATPASEAAPDSDPLPAVRVTNIGMHIGGGPNDPDTKAPIRASVQPHFDDFRRCWRLVADPDTPGDFGVDLRIKRSGGQAAVSHPRTAIRGDGFTDCMVKVFETIDFQRPRKGDTTVSYSLRFMPERR